MAMLARNWSVADEFTALMARRTINDGKQQIEDIATSFGDLVKKIIEQEDKMAAIKPREQSVTATIQFTASEIAEMDKHFQKAFKETGSCARVTKRLANGVITYEIKYRRNGYYVFVSASDLKQAKQKFIQKTISKNIKIGA